MKIIIVGPSHPYRGGIAVYNERLAREFIKEGHDVTMLTYTLQYPKILFPGKTQYSDEPKPSDLKIVRKLSTINPISWIKTRKYLRKESPDLIIVKYWIPFLSPSYSSIFKRLPNKTKVISIIDNIIPHEKRPGDFFLNRLFVKRVDGFVAMSKSVVDDLRKFTKKEVVLTPHPIFDNFGAKISETDALEKIGLSNKYNYILFFGFIRAYKGLDLLLEAFAKAIKIHKNTKLIVAGEFYEDDQKYLEIVEKNNLEDKVVFRNEFIQDSEVVNYFCSSKLIVQPYKTATQSGVTQIGYHFEKPMIVTNVGGLSEIIPDGKVGYVVEPEVESIKDAIEKFFIENKEEEFLINLREEKKRFLWSNMTKTIYKLAERV